MVNLGKCLILLYCFIHSTVLAKTFYEENASLPAQEWQVDNISTYFPPFDKFGEEDDNTLVVNTLKGSLRGIVIQTATGRQVDAWLGIPYAQKPVGNLRFRHPGPITPWNYIRNATSLPTSCFQGTDFSFPRSSSLPVWNFSSTESEDCLFLNVVVPRPRQNNSAVVVHIHGGAFFTGSTSLDYYSPYILASEENLIVVSMQYRLGSLGFLYLETDDAPGNMGLYDQQMALKWVHENIAAFGGDPNKITLFGDSAGSVSVSFHIMDQESRKLFQNAIMVSGTILNPWGSLSKEESMERGLNLAKKLNCPYDIEDIESIAQCLRTKHPRQLVDNQFMKFNHFTLPFGPVVETSVIKSQFTTEEFRNSSNKINILSGFTAQEGALWLLYFFEKFSLADNVFVSADEFSQLITDIYPSMNEAAVQRIIFEYTNKRNQNDSLANREDLIEIVGNSEMVCNLLQFLDAFSEASASIYIYNFRHRSSGNPWPAWAGVTHCEEVEYALGIPLNRESNFTEKEKNLSRRMMTYWANFARTGNPNLSPDGRRILPIWPQYATSMKRYLKIDDMLVKTGRGLKEKQCGLWLELMQQLSTSSGSECVSSHSTGSDGRNIDID